MKIFCKHLKKDIKIGRDAVSDSKWGWICDCGCWTNVAPDCHIITDDSGTVIKHE